MAEKTLISWVNRVLPDGTIIEGKTFNPWWGCLKITEGCAHCYARDIANHYVREELWGPASMTQRRFFGDRHWAEPLKWNRQAKLLGHRVSVFCASMSDVFEDHPQLVGEREKLWKLIEATPWLNWLLLTKRPQNMLAMSPWGRDPWPDNVWAGTSVENQKRAEERISSLLEVKAQVRFLSCEPLLGPLDLTPWLAHLSWIIAGGESGPHFRPLNLDWARSLRDQCQAANVLYHFKQIGGRTHAAGGRMLDGRTWDEMPSEVQFGVNEYVQIVNQGHDLFGCTGLVSAIQGDIITLDLTIGGVIALKSEQIGRCDEDDRIETYATYWQERKAIESGEPSL